MKVVRGSCVRHQEGHSGDDDIPAQSREVHETPEEDKGHFTIHETSVSQVSS